MAKPEDKENRGRSAEAKDPNRPTYVDPVTGLTEKEGLGPRTPKEPKPIEPVEPVEPVEPTPEL